VTTRKTWYYDPKYPDAVFEQRGDAPGDLDIDVLTLARPDDMRRIAAVPDYEDVLRDAAGCDKYREPDECGTCLGCRASAALRKGGVLT
jgi:hypothetical protein